MCSPVKPTPAKRKRVADADDDRNDRVKPTTSFRGTADKDETTWFGKQAADNAASFRFGNNGYATATSTSFGQNFEQTTATTECSLTAIKKKPGRSGNDGVPGTPASRKRTASTPASSTRKMGRPSYQITVLDVESIVAQIVEYQEEGKKLPDRMRLPGGQRIWITGYSYNPHALFQLVSKIDKRVVLPVGHSPNIHIYEESIVSIYENGYDMDDPCLCMKLAEVLETRYLVIGDASLRVSQVLNDAPTYHPLAKARLEIRFKECNSVNGNEILRDLVVQVEKYSLKSQTDVVKMRKDVDKHTEQLGNHAEQLGMHTEQHRMHTEQQRMHEEQIRYLQQQLTQVTQGHTEQMQQLRMDFSQQLTQETQGRTQQIQQLTQATQELQKKQALLHQQQEEMRQQQLQWQAQHQLPVVIEQQKQVIAEIHKHHQWFMEIKQQFAQYPPSKVADQVSKHHEQFVAVTNDLEKQRQFMEHVEKLLRTTPSPLYFYSKNCDVNQECRSPNPDPLAMQEKEVIEDFLRILQPCNEMFPELHRGMNIQSFPANWFQKNIQTGGIFRDMGFLSTSHKLEVAQDFANQEDKDPAYRVLFYISKHFSGRYIRPFVAREYQHEEEVLFKTGTEFLIHEIRRGYDDKGPYTWVHMTEKE